ncbi:PEP/pyruvate-binding domain-containing protein, partial [Streptomyces boncukensis]|uniref:PEP/pyruvate-binding domain-containing protein n=1 Tax=Streptomyces boncukensis TaxID=2711219 RepID=UPI0030BA1F6F
MEPDLLSLSVVPLSDRRAQDASLTGAKAAHLARSAAAGLPVLPGFVLVRSEGERGERAVREAWRVLSRDGRRGLVVRSSSALEDTAESSMAGQFESVLDVRGWEAFLRAVRTVVGSSTEGQRESSGNGEPGDRMAVLVQPMLRAAVGGVLFGADPIAGRADRMLVSAVRGGPDQLVDGSTQGTLYQLTPRGRVVAQRDEEEGAGTGTARALLGGRQLCVLARLARRTRKVFGGPQDMEFGFDAEGRLWLFQSRPITATAPRVPRGSRLLGPGPVAETFPGVLQPLEEDLWLEPLSHGLTLALDIAGAAPRRTLRRLPAATAVEGRAAADLRLLGAVPHPHPVLNFVNPAPGARRLSAAWRVGRLRAALPGLAMDLTADTDRQLAQFPPPHEMLGGQLLSALDWGRAALSALHAQESLAGSLLGPGSGVTGASEALAVLSEGRRRGLEESELLLRNPVLLALVPPSLAGPEPVLDRLPGETGWTGTPLGVGALPPREALRLRVRWVQEMQAAMAWELGVRMVAEGALDSPERIALLSWPELLERSRTGVLPDGFAERVLRAGTPPLPAMFRLADGRPVAAPEGRGAGAGQGAGGGSGMGTVWNGQPEGEPAERPVLVVRTLDPGLGGVLPRLSGLVAETGSPLSHLAVLAREYGVPTAVGVAGALDRFPPGTVVAVDGGSGAVEAVETGETVRASAHADGADRTCLLYT